MKKNYRGLFVFLLAIFIVFTIGAVRSFFSSSFLEKQLTEYWSEKNFPLEIKFENVQLHLWKKIIPTLTIRLEEVSLRAKEECFWLERGQIPEIDLPISFWHSLWSGSLKWGVLKLKNMSLAPSECFQKKVRNWFGSFDSVEDSRSFFNSQWIGFYETLDRSVQGFQFNQIKLDTLQSPSFLIKNAFMKLKGDYELQTTGEVIFTSSESLQDFPVIKANIELSLDQSLLEVQTKHKEAEVSSKALFNYQEGDFEVSTDIHHLPLKNLLGWLEPVFSQVPISKSYLLWVSCHLNFRGNTFKILSSRLRVSSCEVSGEDNKVYLQNAFFFPFSKTKLEPFGIEVKKFSANKLLQVFAQDKTYEWITKRSTLKGRVIVNKLKDIQFLGGNIRRD